MHELKSSNLPNLAVDCSTVVTILRLPTLLVDLLADGNPSHIVDEWSPELLKIHSLFRLGQQDSRTVFTYILQDSYSEFDIADVEGG